MNYPNLRGYFLRKSLFTHRFLRTLCVPFCVPLGVRKRVRKKIRQALIHNAYRIFSGDSWTRTNDPFDVNEVLWAIGQVVKLKYGREHTSKVLEIRAFLRFGLCSQRLRSWCVQLCSRDLNTGVFRCVQGVFTALLCSFFAEHEHGKSLTVMRRQAVFYAIMS